MSFNEIPPKASIWAAGGLVYRTRNGKPEYLVIHRPRYDDWTIPKGKLDPGEKFEDAALREVHEETGLAAAMERHIGTVGYTTAAGNMKIVRYWLMQAPEGSFAPNAEVDEARWMRFKEAKRFISYSRDREVLRAGHKMLTRLDFTRVYLVRHAEAGDRNAWTKPDHLRPLSKAGRKQALIIHDYLTRRPVSRLTSSPYVRCHQTLRPLAKTLGVPLELDGNLEEGAAPEKLLRLIGEARYDQMALSSHGDVISGAIGILAAEGVPMDGPLEWAKGSIWVLDAWGGRVRRGRYVAAPATEL